AMAVQLKGRKHELALQLTKLNALSPLDTLARGYGICRAMPDGHVISGINQVESGQKVEVVLHDGWMECSVMRKGEGKIDR
ncbi:hypothetical protein FDZ73_24965, partial [bacterium]